MIWFKNLTNALQGRHTTFAIIFSVYGCVLQWFHRLDPVFIGFVGTMMGFVAGHSIQENYFNKDAVQVNTPPIVPPPSGNPQ